VFLTAPDTVTREKPGHATAAPTDNLAVRGPLHDKRRTGGTFTHPPYDVVVTVPLAAGERRRLTVVATAKDTAGNTASESHPVKVVTAAAITGLVLSDTTDCPVAGARRGGAEDGAAQTPVNHRSKRPLHAAGERRAA